MAGLVPAILVLLCCAKDVDARHKARHDVERFELKGSMFSDPALAAVLTLKTLSIVWLGGFLGGMASGAAGFAYGVVGTAIWLHAISPLHALMLVVSGGLIVQGGLVFKMRGSLDWGRLAPFLIAGLIGIPVGVALVVKTDQSALRLGVAVFLVVYGFYALVAPRLPYVSRGGKTADAVVGFIGGLMGGLAGLSGLAPAIWTQLRGWPKDVARGVYQPFILFAHIASLLLIGFVALDRVGLVLFVAVVPAIAFGGWVGWMIYGKLSERRFQQLFAGLLVVSGLLLLLRI
jgi:uncharacterized membrane protein YfcA